MKVLDKLKNKVIVSVQAMPAEPLYREECINALMKSVVNGGAAGLRVAGARDVKNAKSLFKIPVIGLTKPEVIPKNWKEIVYITPTLKEVVELIQAGADVIAFDGTARKRPNCTLDEIIKYIKINNRKSMADISTLEEGIHCAAHAAEGFTGAYSDVLRKTNHTVLGYKGGMLYGVYCRSMTAQQVNAFCRDKLKLTRAVMLDGGHVAAINGACDKINTNQ